MNIAVIGGGNIGTYLAGVLSLNKKNKITVVTRSADKWKKRIKIHDIQNNRVMTSNELKASDEYKNAVKTAEVVLIALPSQYVLNAILKMLPYLNKNTFVGVVPGTGGVEFFANSIISKGCVFFGLSRVPAIARLREYGKSVDVLGKKPDISFACLQKEKAESIAVLLDDLFGVPAKPLKNYLTVTLTPSNPLLHTARLYGLFKDHSAGGSYSRHILFYEEWDDCSSETLLSMDSELQALCKNIDGSALDGVISLKSYYGEDSAAGLTRKISSIKAFKGILSPMKVQNGHFIPDFSSRYFTEDFGFGLLIIKAFCEITNTDSPAVDRVLSWAGAHLNISFFKDGQLNRAGLKEYPIPQNFLIGTIDDIKKYYKL